MRAIADEIASAIERGSIDAIDAFFADDVALWSSSRAKVPPTDGRAAVVAVLTRLVRRRAPTRVRVLRNGHASVVLAAYATGEALWSLELQIDPPHVVSVMLWVPHERAALAADDED